MKCHLRAAAFLVGLTLMLCGCAVGRQSSSLAASSGSLSALETAEDLALRPEAEARSQAMAHYAIGVLHETRQERQQAVEAYEKAIALDPVSLSEIALELANAYYHSRNYSNAIALLEKVLSKKPDSFPATLLMAATHRLAGDLENAIRYNQKAMELNPLDIGPYHNIAEIYLSQSRTNSALKILTKAGRQKSIEPGYWMHMGDMYSTLRHAPAQKRKTQEEMEKMAEKSYLKALELTPENPLVLSKIGTFYFLLKRYSQSIQYYSQALKFSTDPRLVQALRKQLTSAYKELNQLDEAITQLQEIKKREPAQPEYYLMLGDLYEEKKDFSMAETNYVEAIKLDPKQLGSYFRLAMVQLRTEKHDDTLKTVGEMQEKFPGQPFVPLFKAQALSEMKKYGEAVEVYDQFIAKYGTPPNPKLMDENFYFSYGHALERGGDFKRAVAQFEKVIELNPNNADALNYLGYMFAEKDVHIDRAYHLIQRALELNPDSAAFLDSMAWVYYRQGKLQKALKEQLKAISLNEEEDAVMFDHLGDIYLAIGQKREALKNWRQALRLDPSMKEVEQKIRANE